MFDTKIYVQRRERLREQLDSGITIFIGNDDTPMNYPANPYHFRQDSSFLYFFGLDQPGLGGVIDVDQDKDILFGNDVDVEDIIWMGTQPSMKDRGAAVGITETSPLSEFDDYVRKAKEEGRKIHYLPPYRPETVLKISRLLEKDQADVKNDYCKSLIRAVVEQRSFKIDEEIAEMEAALETSYLMYMEAMKMIKPGIYEQEVVGKMEGIVQGAGNHMAFPTILTINGQILHNHFHGNLMSEGDLLVVDSGAESAMSYASDITRTFPVSGKFTDKQREIYEVVYKSQMTAIQAIKPAVMYREIHLQTARVIADGLKDIGLMKGDMGQAVESGAHALFFPHGLGHHIGLDVHDMEDLGENFVGYDDTVQRSEQFGLAYLRMAKALKPGHVLTVEPGVYFIPALIDKWMDEKKFTEFIDYDRVAQYRDFGGIRIEDDVLVTEDGFRVLGRPIPKSADELESLIGR
ncbi:aminopeptidase P family protein [Acidobacteriota bacterium]